MHPPRACADPLSIPRKAIGQPAAPLEPVVRPFRAEIPGLEGGCADRMPIAAHEHEQHDLDWGRILELELVAHPKEQHSEIIAMDYAMTEDVLKVRVRAALASYLLRQWLVDCTQNHSLDSPEYRLWLRNTPILYGVANAHLAPGYAAASA